MNKSQRGQIKALGNGRRRAGGMRSQRLVKRLGPSPVKYKRKKT